MIITNRTNFEKVKSYFPLYKITQKIYITRLYGNKKLHPIGYYIPILLIIKGD